MFGNHQAKILQEEIKIVHETYKNKVMEIDLRRIDGLRKLEQYDELFQSIENDRKRLGEANLRLGLLSEQIEKDAEGWKSAALKYQYLFEQMDRVGLQQSEDIFECYKDIEVPRISVREKNKYVTTHLTGSEIVDEVEENVIYDDDEDDIDTEIEILEIMERITDAFNVNDDINDDINDDPTVDIALNALDIVNDDFNDSNDYNDYNDYNDFNEYDDFNDYNDYNEYDGINELFREDNQGETIEIQFEMQQNTQELYEDYINRLTHHINRQMLLACWN